MRAPLAVTLLVLSATAAACAGDAGVEPEEVEQTDDAATALDRSILGRAAQYPADREMRKQLEVLSTSMAARRKTAWSVVERVLSPVKTKRGGVTLPRFQTWYSKEEVLPMFDRLFRGLSPAERTKLAPFSAKSIRAVFPWNAAVPMTLESFSDERLQARIGELADARGAHSLGKDARVVMSPGYVGHLLGQYGATMPCVEAPPAATAAAPSATNFAPCFSAEFPLDAVAVKTRWMPRETPVPVYDYSPAAMRATVARGQWATTRTAEPTDEEAYTMRLSPDASMRLMGIHIMSKELRDWMWITLFWSDKPNEDLGADRPAQVAAMGAFGHYKMCVAVAFDEQDLTALRANGGACSNPYLEVAPGSAATNCIGCHQHGGTAETSESILANPAKFPQNSRSKVRNNFPTDYAFTPATGLEFAAAFRAKTDALSGGQ
jgi:hypothetical protein